MTKIDQIIQEKKTSKLKLVESKDKLYAQMMSYKEKAEKTRKDLNERIKTFLKLAKDPSKNFLFEI